MGTVPLPDVDIKHTPGKGRGELTKVDKQERAYESQWRVYKRRFPVVPPASVRSRVHSILYT